MIYVLLILSILIYACSYCTQLARSIWQSVLQKLHEQKILTWELVVYSYILNFCVVSYLKILCIVESWLQIELSAKNSECCIFKILPRYKVRSVGDEVRYNDQIKFESLKTKGQFLHCSNHRYKDKFHVLELWLVH